MSQLVMGITRGSRGGVMSGQHSGTSGRTRTRTVRFSTQGRGHTSSGQDSPIISRMAWSIASRSSGLARKRCEP